jgi:site-specific DNA-methyltransferase (adenine-specific)
MNRDDTSHRATGDGWSLHLGDCIEGMRTLADLSVDVVITDPPYEAEAHTKGRRTKRDGGVCVPEVIPFAAITHEQRVDVSFEVARTTRRWALVFCQTEAAQLWATCLIAAGLDYVRTMVWIKPDGQPQFTGDRPGVGYESVVVAHRPGRKRCNGGGRTGVFTAYREKGPLVCGEYSGAPHPTTKPLPLMRELVSLFSDPGELVLDPFAGSGSTGVACRQLGRRFLGWELNRDYYDIACRRMRGEEAKPNPAQPSLFGAA